MVHLEKAWPLFETPPREALAVLLTAEFDSCSRDELLAQYPVHPQMTLNFASFVASLQLRAAKLVYAMHSTPHNRSVSGNNVLSRHKDAAFASRGMAHSSNVRSLHRHASSSYITAASRHPDGYKKNGWPLLSTLGDIAGESISCRRKTVLKPLKSSPTHSSIALCPGIFSGRTFSSDSMGRNAHKLNIESAEESRASGPRISSGRVATSKFEGRNGNRLPILPENELVQRRMSEVRASVSRPAIPTTSSDGTLPLQASESFLELPSPNPIFLPPTSAYVHVPFCRRRCHYCDFPITTVGLRGDANPRAMQRMEEYVELVVREIRTAAAWTKAEGAAAAAAGKDRVEAGMHGHQNHVLQAGSSLTSYEGVSTRRTASMLSGHSMPTSATSASAESNPNPYIPTPLKTVFFGGGTPSLLPPHFLSRIVDELRSSFGIEAGAEISMEADPGTFDEARMREYVRGGGVNRVSVGVQSLSDEVLQVCGRTHSAEEALEAIRAVKAAGVENWSVDLMSG